MPRRKVGDVPGLLSKDEQADGDPPDVVPNISTRYRTPGLLLLGSLSAFAAFVGSATCVLMKFSKSKYRSNLLTGLPYASGNAYWPETVSESVSDSDSAAGKIFFTFSLIAGISLFMSWYPYNLRNVYTGPAATFGGHMYWITFRQYLPVVGLFMLIGVSVFPSKIAMETNGGLLCLSIHLTGAAMMFLGYMISEFKCMGLLGLSLPKKVGRKYLDIEGPEKILRQVFVMIMFIAYLLFCLFEVLLVVQDPCCADVWYGQGTWFNRTDPATGITTHHVLMTATVEDTASGLYLKYKMGAFFGECVAGVFLILSHLTIWYYCEERHVKYAEAMIEMVYDQHLGDVRDMDEDDEDDLDDDEDDFGSGCL